MNLLRSLTVTVPSGCSAQLHGALLCDRSQSFFLFCYWQDDCITLQCVYSLLLSYSLCQHNAEQGLCDGRVLVRPSVPSSCLLLAAARARAADIDQWLQLVGARAAAAGSAMLKAEV